MRTREESLSLMNIADGAVVEKFDRALEKILENLMDPNTTDKKREIIIKVELKRNDARTMLDMAVSCVTKPAPAWPTVTQAFMGRDSRGGVRANEILPAQKPLFEDNVKPLRKENGND